MIDHINEQQSRHIVTVGDPIEVLHPDKKSIVNQRDRHGHRRLPQRASGAAPGP
jgi:twitching motility protein PilT